MIFDFPEHGLNVLFRILGTTCEVFVFEFEGVCGKSIGDVVILQEISSARTVGEEK